MNKNIEEHNNNNENDSLGNTSNSDNPNENGKRCKKRSTKKEVYLTERKELLNELNKLTGLDKINHIILYDLENNDKLKSRLIELVPKIKQYYKCGNWGFFSTDEKKGMGNHIALFKAIYKDDGFDITSRRKMCERGGIKKLYVDLYFNKNDF
jgi:hypothetical protein